MVRRKLIKFFGWWGSDSPEDHADETIDRLVRKLSEGEEIDSIDGYVCGVARLVFREYVTKQTKRRRAFEQATRSQVLVEDQIEREARLECYDHCLESLPPESRLLLKRYYQEDSDNKAEQRRALADELGIPMNLLRIRAFRIRKQLRYCLNECLKRRLLEM
ncbi:MAG TPA: sigma-70 family RNA polymerase sigma factor [Blastocatellia bacterium]|nr:sigma-70 family RNA polymerase sigma factor [Blastocatellia bacterium]